MIILFLFRTLSRIIVAWNLHLFITVLRLILNVLNITFNYYSKSNHLYSM